MKPSPKKETKSGPAEKTLDRLAALPGRPEAMALFDDFFRHNRRTQQLADHSKKRVGLMCNFAPEELILAAGALPLRLDAGFEHAGSPLPVDVCCTVRGLAYPPDANPAGLPPVDLTIVPTACDGKRKLSTLLAADRDVFTLELPWSKRTEDSMNTWRVQIRALVRRLEALTGKRIKRPAMLAAVKLLNQRTALIRTLNDLRKNKVPPITGQDAFLVMHASFTADPAWWVEACTALVAELEKRAQAGLGHKPRARLLLTGSPILFPDYKLLEAVQAAGADVVADEMCSGTQRLHHPTVIDESTLGGLIRAVGEKALLPCTCACFSEGQDRRDRLTHLIEGWQVGGVIHHTLRLCTNYDMDAKPLATFLGDRGTPVLSLSTEFGDEGAAGLLNRVEAFVEMLTVSPGHDA